MWTTIKYLAIIIGIVYGVNWFFSDFQETRMKQQHQASLKRFYEEQNRYPRSFEEMESIKSRQDGFPYVEPYTNRDDPPKNGRWMVNEDRGVIFIRRFVFDERGRKVLDADGQQRYKDEY